jgi:tRNA U34 2-thiouridine synthase MnmA/TrmU
MTKIKLNNKEIDIEAIKAILTEEQIQELTKEKESGVFVPNEGEEYWYIGRGVGRDTFQLDDGWLDKHLVYRTQEEALEAQKRNQARIRIIRKIAELNASVGWKVDWDSDNKSSYSLYFSHKERGVMAGQTFVIQDREDYFYFSKEIKNEVLEACAEDYKIMLGIK